MRMRIVVLGVVLGVLILSGCNSTTDSFADNELCRYYRTNSGAASGGQSAPYPITLTKGQTVVLSYVAQIGEGSAEFQLLDDLSAVKWNALLKSVSATTTLDVGNTLETGTYNIIIVFNQIKNYKICWKVDVK